MSPLAHLIAASAATLLYVASLAVALKCISGDLRPDEQGAARSDHHESEVNHGGEL